MKRYSAAAGIPEFNQNQSFSCTPGLRGRKAAIENSPVGMDSIQTAGEFFTLRFQFFYSQTIFAALLPPADMSGGYVERAGNGEGEEAIIPLFKALDVCGHICQGSAQRFFRPLCQGDAF